MRSLGISDRCETEVTPQLFRGHSQGASLGRGAGRGLREGGRASGVEGDVAFDLLHRLMNVAVQYGDGAERLEQRESARRVVRAPAPLRVNRPERDVREDHDRRVLCESGEILL